MALNRLKHLGQEFFFVGLGQALAILFGLFGIRLITRVLDPPQYGELSLALTVFTLSQQLLFGPIAGAVARFYAASKENGEFPAFVRSVNRVGLYSGLTTLAVGMAAIFLLFLLNQLHVAALTAFTFVFSLLSGWNTIFEQLQNAARHRVVVAWHQAISQLFKFLLAYLFCIWFVSSSQSAMAGYAASAILILLSQIFFYRLKLAHASTDKPGEIAPDRFSADWFKNITSYASPFMMWGVFTWIQLSSDRWALQLFSSTNDVGFYTVLYQLGYYPITILSSVLVQFVSPILFERVGDGNDPQRLFSTQKITRRLTLFSLGLTILLSLVVLFIHAPIFRLLTAPGYWKVSSYLPFLVLSGGLFATGQVSALVLLNSRKPNILLPPKISTALIGTCLNFVFSYLAGLSGVIVANLAFSILYFWWVFILAEAESKKALRSPISREAVSQ